MKWKNAEIYKKKKIEKNFVISIEANYHKIIYSKRALTNETKEKSDFIISV